LAVVSLDVFLPFVNLHQEQHLWAQIIAGWLLSAIFLAAVTGLIRND
jgi:hypothetical protein